MKRFNLEKSMNSYDRHQLTAREIYKGEEPPAILMAFAGLIGFLAVLFIAMAVAFNF